MTCTLQAHDRVCRRFIGRISRLQAAKLILAHLQLPRIGEVSDRGLQMPDRRLGPVQVAGIQDTQHQLDLLGVLVGAVVGQELLVGPRRFGVVVLAGKLVRHLAGIARDQGIAEFEADVLAENTPMLVVFAKAGLPMRKRNDGGTVHVTMSLREGAT